MKYLIRKISPWQDQSKFFPFGNPAVAMFDALEEAVKQKNVLEINRLKETGITNNYEYWDVDCTKELIALNDFLVQKYGIRILTDHYNREEIGIDEIISTMFPEDFTDEDFLIVQNQMNRYHYKIMEVANSPQYVAIINDQVFGPWHDEEAGLNDLEFRYYNSYEDASIAINQVIKSTIDRWSNSTYGLVGPIMKKDFTSETFQLLNGNSAIKYGSEDHETRRGFESQHSIDRIDNGVSILLSLLESVGKRIYEVKKLQ